MIPHIQRANGRAIALSKDTGSAGHCHPEGLRPGVWSRLELPPGGVIRFGHNLSVINRIGGSLHPGTPGHTSRNLQQGGITQVNITARSVKTQRIRIFATSSPSRSEDVAVNAVARSIICGRPAPLVK